MVLTLVALVVTPGRAAALLGLDDAEIRRLLLHGPWSLAVPRDPSNAVSGTHGEQLLRPLKLSASESDDLVAFLSSLTDAAAARAPVPPAAVSGCPS